MFKHAMKKRADFMWCSGRDSDPGLRLERPEYLTGLYYRSTELIHFSSLSCFFASIRGHLAFVAAGTYSNPASINLLSSSTSLDGRGVFPRKGGSVLYYFFDSTLFWFE